MILTRLTHLRKSKEWSLQYTADTLGIAKSTYAGYESGHRRPSLEAIAQIADLFDTSTDYILGRVDHPSPQAVEDASLPCLEVTDLSVNLSVDGLSLTKDELQQFIAFVRAKRQLEGT